MLKAEEYLASILAAVAELQASHIDPEYLYDLKAIDDDIWTLADNVGDSE